MTILGCVQPYEVIKEVPQHYERTVIKEVLVPMERVQHFVEQDEVIMRKEIKTHRNIVGEELRLAQLTQETLAEAQVSVMSMCALCWTSCQLSPCGVFVQARQLRMSSYRLCVL